MIPIVSNDQMRQLDLKIERQFQIPLVLLMENAGQEVAREVIEYLNKQGVVYPKILIMCGPGNNGGDGIVCARHLLSKLVGCEIMLLVLKTKPYSKDALINYKAIKKISANDKRIKIIENSLDGVKRFKPDIIIDALFGTGFKGEPQGIFKRAIDVVNKIKAYKIAIDIASGVNGDTGLVCGQAFLANKTVTLGLLKKGLILYPGKTFCNEIKIANLGISYERLLIADTFLLEREDIKKIFPTRRPNGHKGTFGQVLVVAGGNGYSGAACLTSAAALAVGAGIVRVAFPETLRTIIEKKLIEVIKIPLPSTSDESLAITAYSGIYKFSQQSNVLALGPGITTNQETKALIQRIIKTISLLMVIDADGINNLTKEFIEDLPVKTKRRLILTPHPGELERLIGVPASEINNNRIEVARIWAKRLSVILILKGRPTVIGTPNGIVYVNPTGNSGLAKGGSGDVLTGMIAGFLAQGANILNSCFLGVYLHGLAADLGVQKKTEYALLPTDVIKFLPNAIKEVLK
jgi:NAD(P)H-hydrate epimerase